MHLVTNASRHRLVLRTQRRSAPRRAIEWLARQARIAALTYRINSHERYLRECNPDGLIKSLAVDRFHAELTVMVADRRILRRGGDL